MNNEIGKRIQDLRKNAGLTQTQLAEKVSVTFQAVSKWEQGKAFPDISSLPLLSDALQVSIDYLVTGKNYEVPVKTNQHWAIGFVNEMIAPISLSKEGGWELTKKVEGYSPDFAKRCITIAYQTYVKDCRPDQRLKRIDLMLDKLGGVLYNESLGPVQKTVNRMVSTISKRTDNRDKKAQNALKKIVGELLKYRCGDAAKDDEFIKELNAINEEFLVSSTSVWEARRKIDDYLDGERAKQQKQQERIRAEKALNELKRRIDVGFFDLSIGWPESVIEPLSSANESIRQRNSSELMRDLYKTTEEALKLLINTLPLNEKPAADEADELKNFAKKVYGWFGRYIGRHDADYVGLIACSVDESPGPNIFQNSVDIFEFSSFIKRLYKKYVTLVRKSEKQQMAFSSRSITA